VFRFHSIQGCKPPTHRAIRYGALSDHLRYCTATAFDLWLRCNRSKQFRPRPIVLLLPVIEEWTLKKGKWDFRSAKGAAFWLKGLCLASWESCGRFVWRSIEPCDRIAWISSFRRRYDGHQSAAAAGATVGHPRLLRRDLRERLHDTAWRAGDQYRSNHADRQRTDI